MRQVLQSAMDLLQLAIGITKCDDYYKLRQYSGRLRGSDHKSEIFKSTLEWGGIFILKK